MKVAVTPDARGVISYAGRIDGQPLPDHAVVIEVASLDLPPSTAARINASGEVEIVANWVGSGPWYDQTATLADREKPIKIDELGIDPREHPWAMQPRPLTKAEVAAQAKAEAEAKAAAERDRIATISVSDVQFGLACVGAGIITAKEAERWVAAGQIPASLAAAIQTLPAEQQIVARIKAAGEKTFERSSPFVAILGGALGMSADQLDALFVSAAAL